MDDLFPLDNLTAALEAYGAAIAAQYKDNLRESGHSTRPDHLINSIETFVVTGDRAWEVKMRLNDYWKYVEEGTTPHWPPVDKIRAWIDYKPVAPYPMKNGKLPTPKQLAFLISRKIAREGTQGTKDLERAKATMAEIWRDRLTQALIADFRLWVLNF